MQYTVQDLIQAINNEFRIISHLAGKVTAENKSFQFSPNQRTTEELLNYLSHSAPAQINLIVHGGREPTIYQSWLDKGNNFSFDQFSAERETARVYITSAIESLSDNQRAESISLWGRNGARKIYLIDYLLTFLGAYKMQLFLQLKATGLQLDTMNIRGGIDNPNPTQSI